MSISCFGYWFFPVLYVPGLHCTIFLTHLSSVSLTTCPAYFNNIREMESPIPTPLLISNLWICSLDKMKRRKLTIAVSDPERTAANSFSPRIGFSSFAIRIVLYYIHGHIFGPSLSWQSLSGIHRCQLFLVCHLLTLVFHQKIHSKVGQLPTSIAVWFSERL